MRNNDDVRRRAKPYTRHVKYVIFLGGGKSYGPTFVLFPHGAGANLQHMHIWVIFQYSTCNGWE